MITLWMGFLFLAGFILGTVYKTMPDAEQIDLNSENNKLRKENEVLWARLKKEKKIDGHF